MQANVLLTTKGKLSRDIDIEGKVRDIYDFNRNLLLIATDRISAHDWVNPVGVGDKGKILTLMSAFWFEKLAHVCENHMISIDPTAFPTVLQPFPRELVGRSMLVRKAIKIPIEFVLRFFLAGSAWRSYLASGEVCGIKLPAGMVEADELEEPTITPATKAEGGLHDENITREQTVQILNGWRIAVGVGGRPVDCYESAEALVDALYGYTEALFDAAAEYCATVGLFLADGKLEFGINPITGEIMLIDEAFTPDAARFWRIADYQPGGPQVGLDKEDARRWLKESGWDMNSEPPRLPQWLVAEIRARYVEAYERITKRKGLPQT